MANSDAHFPKKGEDVAEEGLAVQVAIMAVGGSNKSTIAKRFGISDVRVRNILKSDDCIAAMQKITREALEVAKNRIRMGTSDLADEVVRVLKQNLKDNNLQAVPHALKVLGLMDEEPIKADQKIIVMLPGEAKPVINVTPKKDDDAV